MNGWFPRFSRRGDVVSGSKGLWLTRFGQGPEQARQILPWGMEPQWLIDGAEVFFKGHEGAADQRAHKIVLATGQVTKLGEVQSSKWAAGAGRWIGKEASGAVDVAADPVSGLLVKVTERNNNNHDRTLWMGSQKLVEGQTIGSPRVVARRVVWRIHTTELWGFDPNTSQAPVNLTVFKGWQDNPVPIDMPTGPPWLLFMTNTDLRLCPWGATKGYIIETGENANFHADALFWNEAIRVVWNDGDGRLYLQSLSLTQDRVDITGTAAPVPIPICDRVYLRGETGPCPVCGNPKPLHTLKEPDPMPMEFPRDAWAIVQQMFDRFAATHPATEDGARAWTKSVVEQLVYSFPNEGYVWKSADPNRPPSKDGVGKRKDGRFDGWDLLIGAGARGPRQLADYPPEWHDLTGQHPIPVQGVNHLGAEPEPEPDPEPDLEKLKQLVNDLKVVAFEAKGQADAALALFKTLEAATKGRFTEISEDLTRLEALIQQGGGGGLSAADVEAIVGAYRAKGTVGRGWLSVSADLPLVKQEG